MSCLKSIRFTHSGRAIFPRVPQGNSEVRKIPKNIYRVNNYLSTNFNSSVYTSGRAEILRRENSGFCTSDNLFCIRLVVQTVQRNSSEGNKIRDQHTPELFAHIINAFHNISGSNRLGLWRIRDFYKRIPQTDRLPSRSPAQSSSARHHRCV